MKTVLERNTYFFFDQEGEAKYEGHINSITQTLLLFQNEMEGKKLEINDIEKLLQQENGLRALCALTGFSNEYFKRLIGLIRLTSDITLTKLSLKEKWNTHEEPENWKDWNDNKISNLIRENKDFRKGIARIFMKGATVPFLIRTMPLFEIKKLSVNKLKFNIPDMIDTLVRYKEKGSYSAQKWNNPEIIIKKIIKKCELSYEKGKLDNLENNTGRDMDFIIPNRQNPKIIIEVSFLATTSSGQGDKAKTEIAVGKDINKYYPSAKFIGFVDGIGWFVRKGDLKRIVSGFMDVFTMHSEELVRFEKLLKEEFNLP